MNIVESFKMALESIFANKMRSFLTMLGIIIGIMSVIAILAVGSGATSQITGTFNSLGASTITVSVSDEAADNQKINLRDIDALKTSLSKIERLSPDTIIQGKIASNLTDKMVVITGGTPDSQYTNRTMEDSLLYGRYYNANEYDEATKVAVISVDAARALFNGQENVVGESVSVKTSTGQVTVRIIGVTHSTVEKMVGDFDTSQIPAYMAMPLTVMDDLQPNASKITSLTVKTTSKDDIETVSQQIVNLLSVRHDVVGQNMYTATNFLQALDQVDSVLNLFIQFIAAVAAIALLVGGIGVMNIMLVSVTERTREIGTRKALGATNGNILFQFLMESVILCLIGGLIGLGLGVALALTVATALDIQAKFTIGAVAFVLLFSSAIGIFFGVYPARKASKLDPIEALRYE